MFMIFSTHTSNKAAILQYKTPQQKEEEYALKDAGL